MAASSDRFAAMARLADGYWAEAARPLTSLVFIAPLLATYEAGVRVLGAEAARNGADVWMRRVLECLDFDQYFLLPILAVSILLGWHYTTRQPWRVSRGVLSGMVAECVVLAVCLRVVLHLQGVLWHALGRSLASVQDATASQAAVVASLSSVSSRLIGFLGAGVYEELLFRLVLLSLAIGALGLLRLRRPWSLIGAVLLTSVMFALAHYVGRHGEPLALGQMSFWFSFLFRLLAGVFFSVLFLYRGFGIAAGSHAMYDILVGLT